MIDFSCLTSAEARRPIRDGDEGKRGQKSETSKQAPARKTEAAVDRRQNNRMLRQCPSPHCAATTAPRNCCPAEQSHNDYARSSAVGKQLKQKKSNSPSTTSLLLISSGLASTRESRTILLYGHRSEVAY